MVQTILKLLKRHIHLVAFAVASLITIAAYSWFKESIYFEAFRLWSRDNVFWYALTLVTLKTIGIVWPPLPGGALTLLSAPIIGWPAAYLSDLCGSVIGSSIAFFLGQKYGWIFLKKIFDEDTLETIRRVKIKPRKEIETIFLMRFFGGAIVEVVCYGAGVLGVRYRNFLTATLLSHAIFWIPLFYAAQHLVGGVLNTNGVVFGGALLICAVVLFYKLKHRYFDFDTTYERA